MPHVKSDEAGFTAIELLIVIALAGILIAIGFTRINPPSSRLFSSDLKAMIHQARYEAIKRNQPVAFVWDEATNSFSVRMAGDSVLVHTQCDGDIDLTTKHTEEYRQVEVDVSIDTGGIVWLPTGQARTCNGAPMVTSDIKVSSQGVMRTVVITMGGKVSID